MKPDKSALCLLWFACCFVLACNDAGEKTQYNHQKLRIAVAANMQFTMQEISKAFTDETGVPCDLVISSSGKLTAQIQEGAPFDVFVSADMKYPSELYNTGFTLDSPKIYAYGKLVMWTMTGTAKPSLNSLKDPAIHHIAIADPKTAPYGKAAVAVLQRAGLYETIKDKLVYGESIAQTNQFIISKASEIGFTAKSVVLSPEMKGKGQWIELDETTYPAIAQGIVALKKSSQQNDSKKFYTFLFSADAQKILLKFGYAVNDIRP